MMDGLTKKPTIRRINGSTVEFEDESTEDIDDIIICTGYVYNYPFLSEKCRITVDENYVRGLYKELICVDFPTLIVMGIPGRICPFPTFELQMRFVLKVLKGEFNLPSKEQMIEEMQRKRMVKDCPNRHFHDKGVEGEHLYWVELAETANIKGIPHVLNKLHEHVIKQKRDIKQAYRILNDEEFEEYEI